MASSKPTIFIVPGAWQLPTAFVPFTERLQKAGYDALVVPLPSVGGTTQPLPGLPEDIAAIRAKLQPLVEEQQKEVLLLTHSAGGVSGSAAVQGLDAKSRAAKGLEGGVVRVVYMAAFMIPKGSSLMEMLGGQPLPWMVVEGDRVTGNTDMLPEIGFNDLEPAEREKWMKEMTHTSAVLFTGKSEFEPWKEGIPCAYIFTKLDGALPFPLQQQLASQLGPDGLTFEIEASHCPYLSKPEELLAAVDEIVAV